MAEILHQLIGSLSHYLLDFIHLRWWPIWHDVTSFHSMVLLISNTSLNGPKSELDFRLGKIWLTLKMQESISILCHVCALRAVLPTKRTVSCVGFQIYMDVSENGGTQQLLVFLLKMTILGCFGSTPIFGNTHIHSWLVQTLKHAEKFSCKNSYHYSPLSSQKSGPNNPHFSYRPWNRNWKIQAMVLGKLVFQPLIYICCIYFKQNITLLNLTHVPNL